VVHSQVSPGFAGGIAHLINFFSILPRGAAEGAELVRSGLSILDVKDQALIWPNAE
jgi:hypothetical protein